MPATLALILAAVAAAPTDKAGPGKLTLRAVDARTGGPLEGVSVFSQGRFGGQYRRATTPTDKAGVAVIEWPAGAKVEYLNLTATKPKFVPIHINWRGETRDLTIPPEKTLRFEPGTTIGGVIRDESGAPIAGAEVTVYSPPTESDQANYVFQLGFPKTDKDGRWHLDEAPENLAEIWARAEHPDFRQAEVKATRNLDGVTVMTRGLSVSGVVVDAGGRPVAGAKAIVGHDIWGSPEKPNARTDAQGKFTIRNCEAGPTLVTVQAEGFAPQFLDATIGARTEPLAFRLEGGATLRARVVDVKGNPVAGAFFAPDTWRGHRSIMYRKDTDADGRFEWRSAPPDEVLYDIGKQGYMSRRHVPLTAGDGVQTVTLYPLLVVSGRATDAETGGPLKEFRVVLGRRFAGRTEVYWSQAEGVAFRDGRYKVTFAEPSDALFVRIEAPGYKAAESRPLKPDEGEQALDFRLERAEGSSGVVLLPDGGPAAGVTVAIGTQQDRITLRSGRFGRGLNAASATTDAKGLFRFAPPAGPFLMVAAGDAGFAELTNAEFAEAGGAIELKPWGRLEGSVTLAGKPGADLPVVFNPVRPPSPGNLWFYDYQYVTRTDAAGKFAFDRVIPGGGFAARVIVTDLGGGSAQQRYAWQEPVDVLPGATARVRIGGKGRPVVGRAVIDGPPGAAVDWTHNEPVTLNAAGGARGTTYAANLDKDGRFRLDDIPAGRYMLLVTVNGPRAGRFAGPGPELGRATLAIEVPGPPGPEPADVGEVTIKVAKP